MTHKGKPVTVGAVNLYNGEKGIAAAGQLDSSGNFAIGDEAAFLGAVSEMLPLKATRSNGEIVLEAAPHICRNKCR